MAYFKSPWNAYEVVVIVLSVVCVAMYGLKEVFGRIITKQLKNDKGMPGRMGKLHNGSSPSPLSLTLTLSCDVSHKSY